MSTKPNTSQITYDTGSNKQDLNTILDTVVPIADYTALRNYTGRATQVRITADGIAGVFKYDSTDTTSTDNGGTIIVAGTKRWKRVFDGRIHVKWFGAKGDWNGTTGTDDIVSIQAAIDYAASLGGGEVYLDHAAYFISIPIEMKTGIVLSGSDQNTIIKKTGSLKNASDVDCVIFALNKNRFHIKNIRASGNRVRDTGTGVVTVSSYGFYLKGCSYFDVTETRADSHINGYYFETCWCCSLQQATAERCQGYGFVLKNANTSTFLRNTTAWGTGGGWSLVGCIYTQLIGCACDHSDAGKRPDDPFLPQGSGGDYQNPSYIFHLSACQGITIISPGCENSYSKWLYGEGAFVTITSPFVYNLACHATNYSFCELRGTGGSSVTILNPNFTGITNALGIAATRKGYFIENTQRQKINIQGVVGQLTAPFGTYSTVGVSGIEVMGKNEIVNCTQHQMIVGGGSPFLLSHTTGGESLPTATIINNNGEKELQLKTVSAATFSQFKIKIPYFGFGVLKLTAFYGSAYQLADIKLIETNGTVTNTLKSWTSSGSAVTVDEAFSLPALTSGYSLYFQIQMRHPTETFNIKEFILYGNFA